MHLDGGSTVLGPFHPIDGVGNVDVTSDGDVVRSGGSRWHLAWARRGGVLTRQDGAGRVTRVRGTTGLWHLARAGVGRLLMARSGNLLESPRVRGVPRSSTPRPAAGTCACASIAGRRGAR